ncbi:lipopolysaccharide heptosyltransferase II [Petrachloros mirabilis]
MAKNILVRGPNWLGDAVMCEPALRGLRLIAPDAIISLLVKPAVAELFMGHPAINHLVLYEDKGRHAGLSGKWALAGELRKANFDLALLFQNAFEAALLAFVAGVPRRYGYATDGRSLLLSDPVAVPDRRVPVHQVQYYWNLLRPMGLTGEPSTPGLCVAQDEDQAMAARLEKMGIVEGNMVIGLNPGSTYGDAKRWLPERFAEVTNRLCQTFSASQGKRASAIVFGAKGEESLGHEIARRLSMPSAVLSGSTSIRELMAAVKRCAVLLTNDTGPMHIASAFRVPVVAVFGPTDWRMTSPYGTKHVIVRQPVDCAPCLLRECPIDHRCMTWVSVDQVYEAAIELMQGLGAIGKGQRGEGEFLAKNLLPRVSDLVPPAGQAPLDGVTVFLDRDGTLNYDPGYLKSAAEMKLLPGVAAALARLKTAGAKLVVVTNQSGVGRGMFTLKDLETIHARLQGLLEQEGAVIDAIYFCPHHPDDGCLCRKPGRGMIDRAVAELQLDLRRSYLVGDHIRDLQLARAIGAKPVLVTTGVVDTQALDRLREEQALPDKVASSIGEAVDWILTDAIKRFQPSVFGREVGSAELSDAADR